MKITNIKESGSNNILLWAISNGADIKEDVHLQSLINDELFYHVTMNNVNFFELFRLTQMYREKIRIIDELKAEVPSNEELAKLFNGSYIPDPKNPEEKAPLYECVSHVTQNFINLALQMASDDDIIKPSALRLFLPMISRKFTVQIPVAFVDMVESISVEESAKLFSENYPETIQDIIDNENHGFKTILQLGFLRGTSIIKYNKRYDQYLKITKYSPLKTCNNNKLYKFGLLGFYKYNNITRGEVTCNLFNPNKETLGSTLKQLADLKTPLRVEFAIQLPIQYMQILENSYSQDVLEISYESSMSTIIDGGILYEDFITPSLVEEDEEDENKIEEFNNSINAYRVRIAETNQLTLNAINMILNNEGDIDVTSTFSMLPSIYSTKAVVTINLENASLYTSNYDPVISEMFSEMLEVASNVIQDIKNTK